MNIPNVLTPYVAPTAKKAVIYIRVSSEEQVENYSLGTQEEHCRREAKHKGYEITEVFREEGKSAKTIDGRPELLRMLEHLRKHKTEIDALIVYRLDRLSRQTQDYLFLRKKLFDWNITIMSANEPTGNTPTEKLLETILASFAQHDNDVRSERTKNGMRARFLSGQITNHVPLGYINQAGYALKDPEKYETVERAWGLMATGTKSLKEMATLMTKWGIRVRHQTVQRMFRNKFYMGILTSEGYPEEVKGHHVPMVTEETFYKVQSILDGRNRHNPLMPKKSRDNTEFPLRRILRCGKCGTPFTGAWSKGRNTKYGYYFCRNRCTTKSESLTNVNTDISAFLKEISPTEVGLKLYISKLRKRFHQKELKLNKSTNEADEELKKLYAQRQLLVEKNMAGIYSDEVFKEQNSIIENRIIAAQASKSDTVLSQYNLDAIEEFIYAKLADLSKTFNDYLEKCTPEHLSQLRCLLGSIFLSGIVWGYPGCSNREFSPVYRAIRNAEQPECTIGERRGI